MEGLQTVISIGLVLWWIMESLLTPILIGSLIWIALRLRKSNRLLRELQARVDWLHGDVRNMRAAQEARREAAPGPPREAEPSAAAQPPEPHRAEPPARPLVSPAQPPLPPEAPAGAPIAPEPAVAAALPPAATQAKVSPPRPPRIGPPPAEPPAPPPSRLPAIPSTTWEHFMGVKLFAWLGGLALFLGVVFFVKYSFEHNLIPPEVRVALGFLTGVALLVGGVRVRARHYAVTSQTLCGTGIVILYAVTFACRSIYHFDFFGLFPTFALMALITATAFLLAVRLDALVVAVLGMLGGFLTPVLLSTGQDNPAGLFGYIALLDVGLVAVALHRRWRFLVALSAVGTVLTQLGWVATFFAVPKVFVAIAIFLGFAVFFLLPFLWADRQGATDFWISSSAILLPFTALGFAFYLLSFPELGRRPGVLFAFILAADLCLLAVARAREALAPVHLAAGLTVFALLAAWTLRHLTGDLLNWALGFYLLFAICHSVFPVVLQGLRPGVPRPWWAHLFPGVALLLVLAPIATLEPVSLLIWPAVLLIDLLAMGLAIVLRSLLAIVAALALTVLAAALWIFRVPAQLTVLPETLVVIGGFAVLFLVGGMLAARWIADQAAGAGEAAPAAAVGAPAWLAPMVRADLLGQVPTLSAALPFLLLVMVTVRLPLADPSPVFGLALLLTVLLLGIARVFRFDWLPAVGVACVLVLEHAWHLQHFQSDAALRPLLWYLGFYAVFTAFPFAFRAAFADRMIPWGAAALAGPLHFSLVYRLVSAAWPNAYMGLLPAEFALPALLGLAVLLRTMPQASPARTGQLAWFGAVALFFVTLIFPIQFERQWITIGWALEGAVLLWLLHRVPHEGLRITGVGLLAVAFARLALNPAVLTYHPRSATPILNWYLYAYGIVTACLFAGARLLRPPRHLLFSVKLPPILNGLGTALAFLLLNIEIADYFSETGSVLTFQFSGNLGRDMTYSIAWAVFALVLLLVGIGRQLRGARYAGLGLLSVTLLKLFLHDLAHLGQLYRIGALIGVAAIAILASFLYQRHLSRSPTQDEPTPT